MAVKIINPDAGKSHGTERTGKLRTDYGRDNSFMTFGSKRERGKDEFKGGPTDLSRSIVGGGSVKLEND